MGFSHGARRPFESLRLYRVFPSNRLKPIPCKNGGDDGIRTHDPLLAGQVLSQLSYTPVLFRVSGLFAFLFEQSLKIEQQEDTRNLVFLFWVFLSVKPFSYGLPFLVTVCVNPSGIDGSP